MAAEKGISRKKTDRATEVSRRGPQQNENFYRQLVENLGEGIGISDQHEYFIFANPAAEDIFGMEPGTLIGRNLKEFLPTHELIRLEEQSRNRGRGKKGNYELRIRRADGTERVLLVTAMPSIDPNGKISGTFAIFLDISDRKQAEAALLLSENSLREILNSLNGLVYVADMKTYETLFVNKFGKDIWGDFTGKTCWQNLQSGQKGPCSFCTNDRLLQPDGTPTGVYGWEFQNTITGKWYECRDSAIRWPDGRTVRMEIATDISAHKQADEKIRSMLAEKELLLKEVHHRVKNNMMVISSLLQIQAQRVNDQKTIMILQESQNRIHAMMTIYEKLYRATDLTHIGLADYFSELTKSLFAAYNIRPGMIELETAISAIELDIDRTIPCGLIINELVSNTLKYAFPGDRKGRIRIEFGEITADGRGTACRAPNEETDVQHEKGTARCAPTYALTVANDGVPLPAGFDSSKSSGFGLQLVIMLAGQLGGKLQAHSREWTEFRIVFPMNPAKTRGATA
jgi:PAS domain S-box-containing protein